MRAKHFIVCKITCFFLLSSVGTISVLEWSISNCLLYFPAAGRSAEASNFSFHLNISAVSLFPAIAGICYLPGLKQQQEFHLPRPLHSFRLLCFVGSERPSPLPVALRLCGLPCGCASQNPNRSLGKQQESGDHIPAQAVVLVESVSPKTAQLMSLVG